MCIGFLSVILTFVKVFLTPNVVGTISLFSCGILCSPDSKNHSVWCLFLENAYSILSISECSVSVMV